MLLNEIVVAEDAAKTLRYMLNQGIIATSVLRRVIKAKVRYVLGDYLHNLTSGELLIDPFDRRVVATFDRQPKTGALRVLSLRPASPADELINDRLPPMPTREESEAYAEAVRRAQREARARQDAARYARKIGRGTQT